MKWLKTILPVLVLALSLVMIFLAFLGSNPPLPATFEGAEPAIACKGDDDCERRHHQVQGAQSNWAQ
jgi:hypothetical protein